MDRELVGVIAPFVVGAVVLATGVLSMRAHPEAARGVERLTAWGPLVVALPMAVFGTQHFGFPDAVASQIPGWIPWHPFWVYLVGTCLVLGALAIALRRYAMLALLLFGTMMFLFVALMHVPRIAAHPGDRLPWVVAARDASFGGGGFALAVICGGRIALPPRLTLAATRWLLGGTSLLFATLHVLHPEIRPGVPSALLMPAWMPLRLPLAYLSALVLAISGVALLGNVRAKAAAITLAVLFLGLALVVGLPIVIARPLAIGTGLNYLGDLLMMAGSSLCFADAAARPTGSHR